MNEDLKNNRNYVIAIGRQFGSGGREVGQRVAQLLDIDYFDKQLLLEASKASGINAEMFEAADERTPKFFPSLWPLNLAMAGSTFMGDVTMSDDNIYKAQCQVMKDLVDRKSCVIVGRTAYYVLRACMPPSTTASSASWSAATVTPVRPPRNVPTRPTNCAPSTTTSTPTNCGATPRVTTCAWIPAC